MLTLQWEFCLFDTFSRYLCRPLTVIASAGVVDRIGNFPIIVKHVSTPLNGASTIKFKREKETRQRQYCQLLIQRYDFLIHCHVVRGNTFTELSTPAEMECYVNIVVLRCLYVDMKAI